MGEHYQFFAGNLTHGYIWYETTRVELLPPCRQNTTSSNAAPSELAGACVPKTTPSLIMHCFQYRSAVRMSHIYRLALRHDLESYVHVKVRWSCVAETGSQGICGHPSWKEYLNASLAWPKFQNHTRHVLTLREQKKAGLREASPQCATLNPDLISTDQLLPSVSCLLAINDCSSNFYEEKQFAAHSFMLGDVMPCWPLFPAAWGSVLAWGGCWMAATLCENGFRWQEVNDGQWWIHMDKNSAVNEG